MTVPKIVWPSAGANELLFAFPPVNVRPFDKRARRHDTIASSGKRQSLLERTDKFLELDITLVPTEVEQYLTRVEEFDHADWQKIGTPSAPTVTANNVVAPDGTMTAEKIDFPATAGGQSEIRQDAFSLVPDATSRKFIHSVFLRADSSITIQVDIFDGVGTSLINASLSTSWQRFQVARITDPAADRVLCRIVQAISQPAKTIFAWGAQLGYDVLGPYVKTGVTIPAAIDRWDTFITAVLDGTNFDYYPDAFAGGNTTYVLEDKVWRPKLQIRGRNRFYEFKLRLREFV